MRRTPVAGNTISNSEKTNKQQAHREVRRVNHANITRFMNDTDELDETLKLQRELHDRRQYAKNGKQRFDPKSSPKLLRK
jgi:hypothetical protein